MTGPVGTLASEALACLMRECPRAHGAMRTAISDRRVRLEIGRDTFDLVAGAVAAPHGEASLLIRSDAATVSELVHGELDLVDALVTDRVHVRGDIDAVLAASTAMTAFLAGALRCDSMPALLQRLANMERT